MRKIKHFCFIVLLFSIFILTKRTEAAVQDANDSTLTVQWKDENFGALICKALKKEEVIYADLLCHVVDASSETALEQIKAVEEVLHELDALDKKTILVLNKIDKAEPALLEEIKVATEHYNTVEISAKEGTNLEKLLDEIEENLPYTMKKCEYLIP